MMRSAIGDGVRPRLDWGSSLSMRHGDLSQYRRRPGTRRSSRTLIDQTLVSLGVRARILVAAQERPTPPVVSERHRVRILPGMDDRQLRLAFPDPP